MTSTTRDPGTLASLDLFTDDVLADPYPWYRTLRDLGPAVRLPGHDVWAVPRHADVQAVLRDTDTFRSKDGVALTDMANQVILDGTVLGSDGEDHRRLRRVLAEQLRPASIRALTTEVHRRADRLVAGLVTRGSFDAAGDLARGFVADVVMELMGLPLDTRDELIDNAAATFEMFGPANQRYQVAAPAAAAMIDFLSQRVTRTSVRPDSWMASVYDAVDAGRLDESEVVPLMSAYTVAGMDTTINGITNAVHLLATHPRQWGHLRGRRATGREAFHEAIRYDAPVQGFGRRVGSDTAIDGTEIPAGDQVWVLYGSAGRDHRRWGASADQFDVLRPDAAEHLALGAGPHACAGNHLAALQAGAVLDALATHCTRLELAGEPTRALNNVLRGWAHLPVRVVPDRRRRR
ncbi:hypothetical protein AQ490_04120 [Wenjunlia vitaminophila]|uniref:Cytochrome P450 n=1 Tax=Wenjunlia vitaminophila TaxID=76728 RepID=A0A0T6LRH9_WENVI|nr:cytochrome P450 [Wenjunlia vitaminophila]KRV48447.1 hypothetical protein AQ490_04120 [Wenjunlia vitaminophila]